MLAFSKKCKQRENFLQLKSLVMCPHAQDTNGFFFCKHFIYETVLNVDAPGIGTSEVTNKLFIRWRILKGIIGKQGQKYLCLCFESTCRYFFGIFESLLGIHKRPTYHLSPFALLASGSAIPCLIDSRIPGTESR
jgi:hypothetical protein